MDPARRLTARPRGTLLRSRAWAPVIIRSAVVAGSLPAHFALTLASLHADTQAQTRDRQPEASNNAAPTVQPRCTLLPRPLTPQIPASLPDPRIAPAALVTESGYARCVARRMRGCISRGSGRTSRGSRRIVSWRGRAGRSHSWRRKAGPRWRSSNRVRVVVRRSCSRGVSATGDAQRPARDRACREHRRGRHHVDGYRLRRGSWSTRGPGPVRMCCSPMRAVCRSAGRTGCSTRRRHASRTCQECNRSSWRNDCAWRTHRGGSRRRRPGFGLESLADNRAHTHCKLQRRHRARTRIARRSRGQRDVDSHALAARAR